MSPDLLQTLEGRASYGFILDFPQLQFWPVYTHTASDNPQHAKKYVNWQARGSNGNPNLSAHLSVAWFMHLQQMNAFFTKKPWSVMIDAWQQKCLKFLLGCHLREASCISFVMKQSGCLPNMLLWEPHSPTAAYLPSKRQIMPTTINISGSF